MVKKNRGVILVKKSFRKRKLNICNACVNIRNGKNIFNDPKRIYVPHTCKKTSREIDDLLMMTHMQIVIRGNELDY